MSGLELSLLTVDAHKSYGPDRNLLHRGRDAYVTIVTWDRDKPFLSYFLPFF